MSFSRRIGALPSIRKEILVSELVMTLSPITIRSNGFNSILRPTITSSFWPCQPRIASDRVEDRTVQYSAESEGGGTCPAALPLSLPFSLLGSAQELKYRLLVLVGEGQRGHGNRLASAQRLA